MAKRTANKLLGTLGTVLLVSLLVFFVFQWIPGDPILSKLGETADPALEVALREEFNLDKPAFTRYLLWIQNALRGNLGTSIRYNSPVSKLIADSVVPTLTLAFMSMAFVVLLGIPLGVYLAKNKDKKRGFIGNLFTQFLISIPTFFMGILLILLFSVILRWVPVMAYTPYQEGILPFLKGLLLPALAIGLSAGGTIARYTRSSVIEQMERPYVQVARNKGLRDSTIFYKHILRNAMVPITTMLGIITASVVGGTVVIEKAFIVPGIGKLLFEAIRARDLPLAQGIILYLTVMVVAVFLLLDILYPLIDPRIGKGERE